MTVRASPPSDEPTASALEGRSATAAQRLGEHIQELYPPTCRPEYARDLLCCDEAWAALSESSRLRLADRLHHVLGGPVRHLLEAGGRQWRLSMVVTFAEVLGCRTEQLDVLAAAVELLHTGSLIVDDVQDAAPLRRGRAAAHVVYGTATAINAGTSAYFAVDRVIRRIASDDAELRAVLYDHYLGAVRSAHAGQALDIEGHREEMDRAVYSGNADQLRELLLLTHQLKSGAVVGAALAMAGVMVNADRRLTAALSSFGTAVGTAYQITDDVADLIGVPRTGALTKRVGEDLFNGKVTMPLVCAVGLVPEHDLAEVWGAVREGGADPSTVRAATDLLIRYDVPERCRSEAETLLDEAWGRLERLLPPVACADSLRDLAHRIVFTGRVA
ncbi:polyprenyl synthetase family protein [Streptomyces sp. AJS327]|uniref:polyprenyl synthetase family protein n=1 Tax=Streptomyces sp. AJS327 TaxID=2545265 RepID=UPI0015DDEEEE|nr:polyprenyl synthetase family protein [Streptomyces sp. AJS327]